MNRPDHAHYVHAVARALEDAGFDVRSVGGHDWTPRGGHIVLGRQDGWRDQRWYPSTTADLLWSELYGWRIKRAGMEVPMCISFVASPAVVATTVGHWVGQKAQMPAEAVFDEMPVKPGTPEFDAALAVYVPEDAR